MLEISDLHKRFGDVRALNGAGFTVRRGEMLGFLGPNGAGKTTAMRSIFRLIKPDAGEILWDGHAISPDDLLRFGYMPEERGLYPKMRSKDQLAYLGRLHGMSASEASSSASEWLERLGLGERQDSTIEQLSHGNQQRVQLAAALVHEPELLVLDEPFAGLDPIAVETMSAILREQAEQGKAVVFSSHQLDLVEDLCEDVAIMNAGRMVVTGKVQQLKDQAPIRHLEIEIDGDPRPLVEALDGVHSSTLSEGRLTAIVDRETDVRGLMARAESAGKLRHFSYASPSLSDLFRAAVE